MVVARSSPGHLAAILPDDDEVWVAEFKVDLAVPWVGRQAWSNLTHEIHDLHHASKAPSSCKIKGPTAHSNVYGMSV